MRAVVPKWMLVLALHAGLAAPAVADPELGFVANWRGQAAVRSAASEAWAPARVDAGLSAGDRLRTAAGSALKMVLGDATLAILDESTAVALAGTEVIPGGTRALLRLGAGRLRVTVTGETESAQIHTATAAARVTRGRVDVLFVPGPPLASFVCAGDEDRGVVVRNLDPAVGGEIELEAGECARVPRGKAPETIAWRPDRLAAPPPPLADPPVTIR